METVIRGISTNTTPFITTILAPQLKLRHLPLLFVESITELPTVEATYSILDGERVLNESLDTKQRLTTYLQSQSTSIALLLDKNYRQKIALLELGFKFCLEIPTATEVIIKTLENNLQTYKTITNRQFFRDSDITYDSSNQLSYVHDKQGNHFLINRTKSVYLSIFEQRILEYFLRRKGFVSKNELSYAGWKHFDVRPNTVTVTIKKLRKKIADVGLPYSIRCLYGYGYTLEVIH